MFSAIRSLAISWLLKRFAERDRQAFADQVTKRLEQLVDVDCRVCGAAITLAELDDLGEIVTCTACDSPWLVTCRAHDNVTPEGDQVRIELLSMQEEPLNA